MASTIEASRRTIASLELAPQEVSVLISRRAGEAILDGMTRPPCGRAPG